MNFRFKKIFFILFFSFFIFFCATNNLTDSVKKEINIVLEIANIYHNTKDYESEKAVLEKFISQRGYVSDKINYNLCLVYYNNSEFKKTIDSCEKFFKNNRAFLDYLRLEGECYKALKDNENAILCYKKIIDTNCANAQDYTDCATLLCESNKKDEAKQILKNAIEDKYIISKALLQLAVSLDNENEEYKILLSGVKDTIK